MRPTRPAQPAGAADAAPSPEALPEAALDGVAAGTQEGGLPEGLERVMDILTHAIQPKIPAGPGKPS